MRASVWVSRLRTTIFCKPVSVPFLLSSVGVYLAACYSISCYRKTVPQERRWAHILFYSQFDCNVLGASNHVLA